MQDTVILTADERALLGFLYNKCTSPDATGGIPARMIQESLRVNEYDLIPLVSQLRLHGFVDGRRVDEGFYTRLWITQDGAQHFRALPTLNTPRKSVVKDPIGKQERRRVEHVGILIAGPSDTDPEKTLFVEQIDIWNRSTGRDRNVHLDALRGDVDASPRQGDRPQAIINEQLLADADGVIAVFHSRVGSPTGEYNSGTGEEIKEAINDSKYVAIYFYEGHVDQGAIDTHQLDALRELRNELGENGLYATFTSIGELRQQIPRDLTVMVNRLTEFTPKEEERNAGAPSKADEVAQTKVDTSEQWVLIHDTFYTAERVRWTPNGRVAVELHVEHDRQNATLLQLKPPAIQRDTPIAFAYRNDALLANVCGTNRSADLDGTHWTIELEQDRSNVPDATRELAHRQSGQLYTADDLAVLRARRILLNDPPPVDNSKQIDVGAAMFESLIQGMAAPVTIGSCPIRDLYGQMKNADLDFLRLSRLQAVFCLKASGTVDTILELTLDLIDNNRIHVRFVGLRARLNAEQEPFRIELEGDCPLD